MEAYKLKLSILKESIPKYEGGTRLLTHFVQQCDKFATALATDDDELNEALFGLILSKLSGEALDLAVTNRPTNWNGLKTLLINRYSDSSSEELLFNKLSTCYQKVGQNYENYADEIKSKLNKIKEHLQLNNRNNDNLVNIKINFYEEVAKNTFVNGIKEPYHSYLMNFELADIEACLVKCRKHDNHEQQTAFLSFMRQRETKPKTNVLGSPVMFKNATMIQTGFPKGPNNFQSKPFAYHPNTQPRFTSFAPNFNTQPRFAQPQTPGTPRFNFTNQRDVGKSYQPTPMSISTRNTNLPNQNNFNRNQRYPFIQNNSTQRNTFTPTGDSQRPAGNNFFKSTGPPNFIAEELHHQENLETNVDQHEQLDYNNEEEPETQQYDEKDGDIEEQQYLENFQEDGLQHENT